MLIVKLCVHFVSMCLNIKKWTQNDTSSRKSVILYLISREEILFCPPPVSHTLLMSSIFVQYVGHTPHPPTHHVSRARAHLVEPPTCITSWRFAHRSTLDPPRVMLANTNTVVSLTPIFFWPTLWGGHFKWSTIFFSEFLLANPLGGSFK